jgi:hypothetical protein
MIDTNNTAANMLREARIDAPGDLHYPVSGLFLTVFSALFFNRAINPAFL